MTGPDDERADEELRVAELVRVNRELAAQVRDLAAGRIGEPRRSTIPAARGVARLQGERDALAAELEAATAKLAHLERHNRELRDLAEDRRREVERMRSDPFGMLRRLWKRVSRH